MSVAVEARSLSSLTSLAANPPPDPRQPGQPLEPLTLYIARVPGSRDVFLTPLKPREKVVTAEDIQSCLYYFHVESSEDGDLLEDAPDGVHAANPIAELPVEDESLWPTPLNPTTRRPLPRVPAPAPAVAASQSRGLNASKSVSRKPVAPPRLPVRPGSQAQENVDPGMAVRRPVPPTHLPPSPPYPVEDPPTVAHLARESVCPNGNAIPGPRPPYLAPGSAPSLPARPQSRPTSVPVNPNPLRTYDRPSHDARERPPELPRRPSSVLSTGSQYPSNHNDILAVTVIRRDPGSGEQWNVARITDPPIYSVPSDLSNGHQPKPRRKEPGVPMYIDVGTPGYRKFLSPHEDAPPELAQAYPFRRRLCMETARIPESGPVHRKMRSNGSIEQPMSSPPSKKGLRGYVFASPWNGRCEFSSSNAGRSLKCKHHTTSSPLPSTVSELRFNLPGSHLLRSAAPPPSAGPLPSATTSKRSSLFSRPLHRRHGSAAASTVSLASSHESSSNAPTGSSVDDEHERMDLSLGQEAAGGGLGGKQAKLGKLIIEAEGLMMMDLTVAANMALWWRVYEKTNGSA